MNNCNNLHYYSYSLFLPQNQRTTRKRHDSFNPTTSIICSMTPTSILFTQIMSFYNSLLR